MGWVLAPYNDINWCEKTFVLAFTTSVASRHLRQRRTGGAMAGLKPRPTLLG